MPRSLGRYELLRPLARGGMADVFLARRRGAAGVEKRLVVKRIRPERAGDPRFLALFVKEARLSVDLAHANIVTVFDFGRIGDELFLAMEYVEGCDLAAAVRRARERGTAMDPVLVAHVGAEACLALDYAHRRGGVVHRDVTPRNVLLSFAGEVKLTDFGVASLAADADQRVRGTPAYMSPEQARGESLDGRSDLFSLGLVLVEAATGVRVYKGADQTALLAEARVGAVPPLPESLPLGLREAIERATRTSRDERFADARALHAALDAVVVSARAAETARPAPSHELASWLAGLFPEGVPEAAAPLTEEDAGGSAPGVTLAEDGAARVAEVLGAEDLGDETMRSMAETMGEGEAAPVPPASPVAPRRRLTPLLVIAAAAFAAGATWLVASRAPVPTTLPTVASAPTLPDAAVRAVRPDAAAFAEVVPDAPAPVRAVPVPPKKPSVTPPPPTQAPRLYPVELNSRPWARVFIDGKYVDDTPFRAELPAGSHKVRFENPQEGSSKTIVIEVPRDRPVVETLDSP